MTGGHRAHVATGLLGGDIRTRNVGAVSDMPVHSQKAVLGGVDRRLAETGGRNKGLIHGPFDALLLIKDALAIPVIDLRTLEARQCEGCGL